MQAAADRYNNSPERIQETPLDLQAYIQHVADGAIASYIALSNDPTTQANDRALAAEAAAQRKQAELDALQAQLTALQQSHAEGQTLIRKLSASDADKAIEDLKQ
jgi:hypothetical protein